MAPDQPKVSLTYSLGTFQTVIFFFFTWLEGEQDCSWASQEGNLRFLQHFGTPPDFSPIGFPSPMSYTDSRGWGAQCGAPTLYSSGRSTWLVRSLPTVCTVCHRTRGGFFARLCLCLSYLLDVVLLALTKENSSSSFQIKFRGKWSLCSCRFVCPWEEVSSRSCYRTILEPLF